MALKRALIMAVALTGLFACKREEFRASAGASVAAARVVDSIVPVDEATRRFKAARGDPGATVLEGASNTRAALIDRFARALAARDTVELRAMALSAGEFIDLYYPTSIYSKPPYRQSPELVWFLIQQNSEKGIRRALDRYPETPNQETLLGPIFEYRGKFKFVSFANDF